MPKAVTKVLRKWFKRGYLLTHDDIQVLNDWFTEVYVEEG